MSEAATESTTDAEVAAALGVGGDEQQVDDNDTESDEQDSEDQVDFDDLPKSWQDEIRKLRRQAAAQRVAKREARQEKSTERKASTEIDAAREAGREEARAEHGVELTEARIRAELKGIIPDDDLDDFVGDLSIARYVTDDHKPDLELITVLKERQERLLGRTRRAAKVSNGRSGGGQTKKSNAELFADSIGSILG